MRKRIISIVLLLLTVCLIFAGCGSNGSNAANTSNATNEANTSNASNETAAPLADGTYTVDFKTDSSMFHINEAYKGKATLTVSGGKMTVHIVLSSKKIVKLFYGLAEDAKKDGAKLIEPTVEKVKYSDGAEEEVYAFDVPVPYLDDEFDCALIGTKEKWYDHKVSVSNPEAVK